METKVLELQGLVNNMRHILYKITNNIHGKYYIGRHSTKNSKGEKIKIGQHKGFKVTLLESPKNKIS